jgi:NAD(P)-dependent dehydrogenase (short-subunit alcohol dehydrogenase family)
VRRTILITGASSGIGKALARRYAREGCRLALLGRHERRLADTAGECRALGADVTVAAIDVRDRAALATWIENFDRSAPVDLVIANAGVMEGRRPGGDFEPADAAYRSFETNTLGVFNTVQPLLPKMMARGRGQIAIISSIAGFTPLPDAPSYCASKSAVINYGLSLRALLGPRGIRVSVICPGYVDTPMMQRESGAKPFKMTAEKAAELICRGLERDRALIVFPRFFALLTRIGGLLPDRIRQWTMAPFRFTVSDPD